MYCERCNRLVFKEKCTGCGRKGLRVAQSEDFCFLAEPEPVWVQALRDLLQENGVEYMTRNVYGAGMIAKTGIPQRIRFFVRYRDYQRAKELNDAFFNGSFLFDMD